MLFVKTVSTFNFYCSCNTPEMS